MLEKALALTPQAAEAQAKALDSRGARILLDKKFFTPSYASDRIDSAFFSLRQTKQLRSGFFVTMSISVPPCETNPSYDAILKKHGAADFIQTSTERRKITKLAGGTPSEDKDPKTTTYYYDFFGFVISNDDKLKTVQHVVTHANDFSKARDKNVASSYGSISLRNLTLFYKQDKEVGRLFYFNEGKKEPICIIEPPVGKYKQGDMTMEYLGKGNWLWLTHFQDGSIAREIPFRNHRMNGKAKGFFANGKPSFIANYSNGVLHGEVIQYTENSDTTERSVFKHGKKQP